MSLRLVLALGVLILDLWAIERVWRPANPHQGRLRWTAAIVLLPVLGAVLAVRRIVPAAAPGPEPVETGTQ